MTQRKHLSRLFASAIVALGLFAALADSHAQAVYTADKGADIFLFGGFNYTSPDFGTSHDTGIILGGDYTRYFNWRLAGMPIDPSLEIRGNDVNGDDVKQRTAFGGIKLNTYLKNRYHPYIDALVGIAIIDYAPAIAAGRDQGMAYSFGVGTDIDLVHHFQLKLDYQLQSWNLGINGRFKPQGGDYTLSPQAITIGVAYHIPFKSNVGPNSHSTKPPKEDTRRPAPQSAPTAAPAPPAPDTTTAPADTTAPAPAPTDNTPAPTSGTSTPPPAN